MARVVAAEATTLKERTAVMAHMSIAQGLGFSCGPGTTDKFPCFNWSIALEFET